MPRRSDDSDRVGLNWAVSSRSSSRLAKLRGPFTKSVMCLDRAPVIPGTTSTRTTVRTSSGASRVSAMVVRPPSDMPTTAAADGCQLTNRGGHVDGVALRTELASGAEAGSVGVAVAGQVDGHQRAVEGHGHGVPGVGVLGAPVEEHQLGRAVLPHQSAQPSTGTHLDRDTPDGGRRVEAQAVLGGVLVEQAELVVVDALHRGSFYHAGSTRVVSSARRVDRYAPVTSFPPRRRRRCRRRHRGSPTDRTCPASSGRRRPSPPSTRSPLRWGAWR